MKIAFVNNVAVCSDCGDRLLGLAPLMREHNIRPVYDAAAGSGRW